MFKSLTLLLERPKICLFIYFEVSFLKKQDLANDFSEGERQNFQRMNSVSETKHETLKKKESRDFKAKVSWWIAIIYWKSQVCTDGAERLIGFKDIRESGDEPRV